MNQFVLEWIKSGRGIQKQNILYLRTTLYASPIGNIFLGKITGENMILLSFWSLYQCYTLSFDSNRMYSLSVLI